jgi:hypothetical protein
MFFDATQAVTDAFSEHNELTMARLIFRALVLLRDVGVNLLVVPARVFFLPFPKWYVVGDTPNSSVSPRILLSQFERNAYWSHRNAARPIELDVPCANILFGFLHGISRIPSRIRGKTNSSRERQC